MPWTLVYDDQLISVLKGNWESKIIFIFCSWWISPQGKTHSADRELALSYKTLQTLISDNKVLLQEEKINQINTQEFELLEGITFVFFFSSSYYSKKHRNDF